MRLPRLPDWLIYASVVGVLVVVSLSRRENADAPPARPPQIKPRGEQDDRPAGEAVRALAWLGPEKAATALEALKRKLGPAAFGELVSVGPRLPTWLARSVSQAAHV